MRLRTKISVDLTELTTTALSLDLQSRFVWAPHSTYPTSSSHLRILTRAGWANVSLVPSKDFVSLFVRFDTPILARLCGLNSNENTGKWNHTLPVDCKAALEQVEWLFGSLIPKNVLEAEFFAAVQDLLSLTERREWSSWDALSLEQKEQANNRKTLSVRRICGALSTDRSTSHPWCPHCGTDYSGQSAQKFLTAAGRFLLNTHNS